MRVIEARITGCRAWLMGRDNAGVARFAPAGEVAIPVFARDTLGNFYARVATVMGYGVQAAGSSHWDVFGTLPEAREHARTLGAALTETSQSASA